MLREGLDGHKIRSISSFNLRENFLRLPEDDLRAQLQYTGGQLVFGGESRGVKIDYILVLTLVEGTVDIDEFWRVPNMTKSDLLYRWPEGLKTANNA
jgi:hypothetical protein